ncbi:TIGR04283 family arsenosugar biosynthesis glycosyltransferase [Kordiimonas sp. SCSIO 12610]|uniref:TIGR04283 family arsenosugar biosynthesis glycosyltransferase n=1 Tax=Kordiimonas sp. SCSIO 12610 TaxID=2829597 RepID=UPI00210E6ED5|nr:TIGR04283 family arsenosugar biosynthesis glycosyltransferase [Kordiimonas sp. SCSIO 12610]UTW55911.1 TIGR04283 family arsenosugar biosynthesis glycosyltransferase [Kordiimonas sp. SCSIO 12610]
MTAKLSIIIPCYRDEEALTELLPTLKQLSASCELLDGTEIIVVDGASSRDCKSIVEAAGGIYLSEDANRGKQILSGVKVASGNIFWFLHADVTLDTSSVDEISKKYADGVRAGYFKFAFSGPKTSIKRFLAYWVNLRSRIGGIAYGDQGLFIDAETYFKAGGHAPLPLFEEARLMRRLKRGGLLVPLALEIYVNSRRWERDGFIKRTLSNRIFALLYALGFSAERISGWYRTSSTSQNSDLH